MPTNIVVAIDDQSNIDAWGLRPYGTWSAGTYPKGAVVTHSGSLWLAAQNTSQTPGVGSDWTILVPSVVGATGAMFPQGAWNATTNVPALASGVGTEGYVYRVSTAGATTLDTLTDWNVGDLVVYLSGAWRKIRGHILDAVDITDSTPAGRTLLTSADAAAQRTALGATPKGVELFTAADAAAARSAISAPSTTGGSASGTWGISITGNADGSAKKLADSPGNPPHYACRAWVRFNGTGTVAIDASGNASSVTDNGPGDYTFNFATAMPDANYCVVANGQAFSTGGHQTSDNQFVTLYNGATILTTSVRINTQFGNINSGNDFPIVYVAIFR